MLDAVKRYALWILLLHVGLLIVVGFVVLGAIRQVQDSAREEVQSQSKERLELLANQTARGLESQYASILSDLDVMLRDETATTMPTRPQTSGPASVPGTQADGSVRGRSLGIGGGIGGRAGAGGRGMVGGRGFMSRVDLLSRAAVVDQQQMALLWRQLRGRVSQIFLVNLQTHAVALAYPENARQSATMLARTHIDWIKSLKDAEMSSFQRGQGGFEGTGFHLIAVPAMEVNLTGGLGGGLMGSRGGPGAGGGTPGGPGGPGVAPAPGGGAGPGTQPVPQYAVVVVVPIDNAQEKFLTPLNSEKYTEVNAILVNDAGDVLVSNDVLPVGANLLEDLPAAVRPAFEKLLSTDAGKSVPTIIDRPFVLAGKITEPQIVAAAQVSVATPRHWTVLVSSPLADVDVVVNTTFRAAVTWAMLALVAIVLILVSSASFLIRARVKYERTRHALLTREIEQARHIQLAWLPDLKSVPAGIEVSAANLPASHVSGDFYNWFALPSMMMRTGVGGGGGEHAEVPSGKVAIVIGDVTGHGMAAAFLMATTQMLVRMTMTRYMDAGRCLREVNRQLCMQSGGFKGQFVTMLVMVLDTQHNTLQVASAGHPAPLIETAGKFDSLDLEPQFLLGVNQDEEYSAKTFSLEPGAAVVLYTDGVVEAENAAGNQYTVENLLRVLQGQENGQAVEPAERIHAVLNDVKRFCGNRELMDDVTLVALRTSAVPAAVS